MDNSNANQYPQPNLFGTGARKTKKLGDVCSPGPSGTFRQSSESPRTGTLSSCARAARQSIGGIGNLINRRMASGSGQPQVPWPNNLNAYEVLQMIGTGATANVYVAHCITRNERCAIKKINLEKFNTNMEELLKEIQAMSICCHENVVTYYTSFVVGDELWLILKLLEGGSLLDILKHKMRIENCSRGVLDEVIIATILKEVLKGLDYFHTNGLIHRDIKSGNILLGVDGEVQIADFGVSAWLANGFDMGKPKMRHTFVGTPCWMAPEVMQQNHGYNYKADIWSFGITAIELATGKAPYHNFPPMKVLMLTMQNAAPTLETANDDNKEQFKAYGRVFRKMIYDCLQKDPDKRPTAKELLQHPFFKKAKDKKYLSQYYTELSKRIAKAKTVKKLINASASGSASTPPGDAAPYKWIWSDDDDDDDDDGDDDDVMQARLMMPVISLNTSASEHVDSEAGSSGTDPNDHVELSLTNEPPSENGDDDADEDDKNTLPESLSLILRIRSSTGQLDDIRFEFGLGKDKPDGIASELEMAGLVHHLDVQVVAANLRKFITERPVSNSIIFKLESLPPDQVGDDKALLGYAKISLGQ